MISDTARRRYQAIVPPHVNDAYSYCVTFVGKASVRGAYARSRDIAAVV